MTLPWWERLPPPGSRTSEEIMADVKALHEHDNDAGPTIPEPEVRSRPVADLPRALATVANRCDSWRATYARGPVSTTGGETPWRMADSYQLKGRKGRRFFVAVWIEDPKGALKFHRAYAHGIEGAVNATQLKAYLTQDVLPGLTWTPSVGYVPLTPTRKGDRPCTDSAST